MRIYFAPMEGLTGPLFRQLHHRYFPGVDRYYTPFLSPTAEHRFTRRDFRETLPEAAGGAPTVPQLLTKSAADFLWAAGALRALGYDEVNFNLGCPSGTVVAKGKGAGLLSSPERLDELLGEIFATAPLRVSVKTRLGLCDPAEFERLLPVLERYPLCELIVHPRTRAELYQGQPHRECFAAIADKTALPLCYNGDINTPADYAQLAAAFPALPAVMIGRGLVANPALAREIAGGAPLERGELRTFHDALYAAYCDAFGAGNAVMRMKEVWSLLRLSFAGSECAAGRVARAKTPAQFESAAAEIFANLPLRPRR